MVDDWAKGRSRLNTVPDHLKVFEKFTVGWMVQVASYYLTDAKNSQKVFYYMNLKASTLNEYGPATNDAEYLLNKLKYACKRAENLALSLNFPHHNIKTELKFDVFIPGHNAKHFGFIDVYDPVLNVIFDWKASKDEKWITKQQIVYYAYMHGLTTGKKVTHAAWLLPLKPKGPLTKTIKLTDGDFIEIQQDIDSYLKVFDQHLVDMEEYAKINTNNMTNYPADAYPAEPNKSSECSNCPYKSICPKHSSNLFNFEDLL